MSPPNDSNRVVHHLLSGARWSAMLRFGAQSLSWLSTIIVVRFLTPGDYGLSTMLDAPLELLLLLSTLGLDSALVQIKKLGNEELQSVFGCLLLVNGALFLAYFFGGSMIASYFNEPRLDLLAKALAFIFLIAPFRVLPNALLDRDLKFKLKAAVELVASVIATTMTLILAVMGAGVWALVSGVLTNRILMALMLMIFQPWYIRPSLNFPVARRMLSFGAVMALSNALILLSAKVATFIVGPSFGAEKLGLYAVAMQFALLPLAKIMPVINPVIFPAFSKFQGQKDVAAYYLERSLSVVSLVFFPMVVGMACIAEESVSALFGEKWSASALPLALLSLVMPFRMVTYFLKPVISAMGRADLSLKSGMLHLGIIVPLSLLGIRYGVIGLVMAWVIAEPSVALATAQMSKEVLNLSVMRIMRSLKQAAVSSVVMAACVFATKIALGHGGGLESLALEVGVGAVSYYLALRLFYRRHLEDAIRILLGRGKTA